MSSRLATAFQIASDDLKNRKEDIARDFVSGGIAGALSRTAVAPLERLKIMFMCGGIPGSADGTRVTVVKALKDIYASEGFKGYFKGNAANVVRIMPYTAIQLSSFPFFKSVMSGDPHAKKVTPLVRFYAGVSAGVLSTLCTYPLDFIRTRLSLKGNQYKGMVDGMVTVFRQEGFLKLYTGINPTIAGIIPYSGIQLAFYDIIRDGLQTAFEQERPSEMVTFTAGAIGSTLAQTVAFPFETIRRRMHAHTTSSPSFRTELMKVVRKDGFIGLYKGLLVNYLKIVPASGINFIIFENCKDLWTKSRSSTQKTL